MKIAIMFTKATEVFIAEAMVADLQCGLVRPFVSVSSGYALLIDLNGDNVERLKARSDAFSAFIYGDHETSRRFHVVEAEPACKVQ